MNKTDKIHIFYIINKINYDKINEGNQQGSIAKNNGEKMPAHIRELL